MPEVNPYTEGYFERGEGSHYHGYEDWPQFKQRAEWIKREYSPDSVLEVGCAKGFLVKHLRELGVDAHGFDVSGYAISKADEVTDGVFAADMTKPLHKMTYGEWDLVVSFDVLEHVPVGELDQVLDNLKAAKRQFHMVTTTEYDFGGDHTHYTMKPKQWWVDKFNEAGIKNFKIIHAGEQELFE